MKYLFYLILFINLSANAENLRTGSEVTLLSSSSGEYKKCFTFSERSRYKFAVRNIKEPNTLDTYYQEYDLIDIETNLRVHNVVDGFLRIGILFDWFSLDRFAQYGEASLDLSNSPKKEGDQLCFDPDSMTLASSYPKLTSEGQWQVYVRDSKGLHTFIPASALDLPIDFLK